MCGMRQLQSRRHVAWMLLLGLAGCGAGSAVEQQAGSADKPAKLDLPDVLSFQARGSEFQWSFTYAGNDGQLDTPDDVRMGNTLLLPSEKPVELCLVSDDYIYILTAPGTGQREIAVPDMVHSLTFDSGPVGDHDLLSDPMCGYRAFHDEVMGRVSVVAQHEFAARLLDTP